MERVLPRGLDDVSGMRAARWFRESTSGGATMARRVPEDRLMARQWPTRRHLEVLRAYLRAGSVAAAACELGIGETTVRQH